MRHRLPTHVAIVALLFGASCEEAGDLEPEVTGEQAGFDLSEDADLELGRIEAAATAGIVRAELTTQLQEYVLLMSLLGAASIAGTTTTPIRTELDVVINDLSDTIGLLFGATVGDRFYQLWAPTPALYARYAVARRTGNTSEQTVVKSALSKWLTDTTNLLVNANPYVSRAFLSAIYMGSDWTKNGRLWFLKEDIMLAIEAQVPGNPYESAQYTRWRATAYKMQRIADHLVTATERKTPDRLAGDGTAPGAEYRVALAYLFGQMAYTGAWEIRARIGKGGPASAARSAQDATRWELGVNVGGIKNTSFDIPPIYDFAFRDALWSSLSTYLIQLTAYTNAKRTGSTTGATNARNALYTWSTNFAALFANKNPYVDRAWLQAETRAFVDQMLTMVDRQIANNTSWYALVNDIEDRMARVGGELAIDIETHRPSQVSYWSTKWHP